MPTDHPDGTRPIVISRADIKTPIDFQKQTTNVKTNIAESEINVPTKIAESAINIPTKIAESAINVPTNIKEQAINVKTNFKEQEVGVYPETDWEVKEGNQRQIVGYNAGLAAGSTYSFQYTVPAGKVVTVYSASFLMAAAESAERAKQQTGYAALYIAGQAVAYFGGNGGQTYTLGCPIEALATEIVQLQVTNMTDHSCNAGGSVLAIEV